MKFAKELERDLVPEWQLKYLNYKQGKKKLKAITRALRNVNQTPRLRLRGPSIFTPPASDASPQPSLNRDGHKAQNAVNRNTAGDLRHLAANNSQNSLRLRSAESRSPLPLEIPSRHEETPLNGGKDEQFPGMTRYGSIIGSPPKDGMLSKRGRAPPSLKLPGAALDLENTTSHAGAMTSGPAKLPKNKSVQFPEATDNAFEVGKTRSPTSKTPSIFNPKRINSYSGPPTEQSPRPLLKRMFSISSKPISSSPGDMPLELYRDLDMRQAEFFKFLDKELNKIETFYKEKEDEASERLEVLREQLHIMRDRRLDELISHQAAKIKAKEKKMSNASEALMNGNEPNSEEEQPNGTAENGVIIKSSLDPVDTALEAVKSGKYGKTTKAMADLATPSGLNPQKHQDDHRDFTRRPEGPDVSYQSARRKLKVALQEYYRGLELLKSYALLNRTAFRKINKKYDKTVHARPPMRYMTEKVSKAWFVQSDVIDGYIRTVEDLYARYFEKGNHKVAVGKLRVKMARAGDFTENSFRNGLMLAAGLILGVQGTVYGAELLNSDNRDLGTNTSYLLQIYAGYFLMDFLFLLFCMACRVWHESKINYIFVFEYDTRHHLDWRQLCELPCFFFFLLGLFMWLNFSQFGNETMYLYYPVILIAVSVLILFLPLPILYYRSRQWLLYSTWRLLLAGVYPVEFRDFYLGDMFCSLTYAMGNIELFFCLYANEWGNPAFCNSSHSRLLGFFSALPGIWRALQCLRRYYDTRNVFPHLVNCGKYTATILFYVTLSIYRIHKNDTNRGLFISFAVINSVYCSVWDVIMDWSLGDPYAKHKYLRPMLGYKKVWMYYAAMIIDPILRFNWIPYAVIPLQIQHSAVTSFVVAFSEVCRRGMWTLFRVENEHCTNVGRFRASRDIPLPYEFPSPEILAEETNEQQQELHPQVADHEPQRSPLLKRAGNSPRSDVRPHHAVTFASEEDLEAAFEPHRTRSTTRRRANSLLEQPSPLSQSLNRVGSMLRDAHAQDFERKKRPELGRRSTKEMRNEDEDDTDEDYYEDDEQSPGSRTDAGEDEDPRDWEADQETVESSRGLEVRRGGGAGSSRSAHGM